MESKHGEGISRGKKVKEEKVKIKINDLPKKVKAVFFALPVILSFSCCFGRLNGDTWFLLKYGQVICDSGLPATDPLSMHSDFNIVIQQWLTDVLFWKIYSFAGGIGLLLFISLCTLYITYIVFKLSMAVSNNNFFSSYISCMLTEILMILFVSTTRPQTLTVTILVTELYLFERYMEKSDWKFLIPIPFLSVLQINLHASMWFVQFIVLLPFLVDSFKFDFKFIKCQGAKVAPLLVNAVITAAAGLINPYGIEAVTYLFRSYGIEDINRYINEMKPLNINGGMGFCFALCFALLLVLNFRGNRGKGVDSKVRYILLVAGFGFMLFSHIRNGMFFAALTPFTMAYCLRDCNPKISYEESTSKKSKVLSACLLVLLIGLFSVFAANDGFGMMKNAVQDEDKVNYENAKCERAVQYIIDNYSDISEISIYSSYNDGAYLEFYDMHPYIDARAEVFLKANNGKEDVLDEYFGIQYKHEDEKAFLNKYDFDLLLVNKNDALKKYLVKDSDYKEVYSDDYCSVYEHIR